MEELVTLIFNNGVGIACLVYFMYYNKEFALRQNEMLTTITNQLQSLIDKM